MKKLFLAIATVAMIFATSCKKENVNEPVNPEEIPSNSFLCEIDNGANPQNAPRINDGMGTMTTTNGTDVFWKTNDAITVNGKLFTNFTGVNKGKAYFESTDKVIIANGYTADEYFAFYPENIQTTTSVQGKGSQYRNKGTLYGNITVENDNNAKYLPMFAYSATDHWLTFHNICAVLELHLPVNCSTIVMKADQNIYGTFEVKNYTTAAPYAELVDKTGNTNNSITLSGSFTTNDYVYIAIPKGTYTNVSFSMDGTDGKTYLSDTKGTMTVDVNTIYPASLKGKEKGKDYTIPNDAFYFTAAAASTTVTLSAQTSSAPSCTFEYNTTINSTDNYWQTYTLGTQISLPNAGDKVYFRAKSTNERLASSTSNYHKFSSTGNVTVSGNICYLLNSAGTNSLSSDSKYKYAYAYLFKDMTTLTDASGLILPSVTSASAYELPQYCFEGMFDGCSNLLAVFASLPSVNVNAYQYRYMFRNCSSLTTTPSIGGSALKPNLSACESMFQGCTSLQSTGTIKIYPSAAISVGNLFKNMFAGCTALTTVNVELSYSAAVSAAKYGALLFSGWLPDNTGTINVTSNGAQASDFTTASLKLAYYINQKTVTIGNTIYTLTPANWTIILNGDTQNPIQRP